MSYSYNSSNSYLNKKRGDDDSKNYRYERYDKYDKFDKYSNHYHKTYHNIMPNNYYNSNSRYKNSYYPPSKSYHNSNYLNKNDMRREYKSSYQKYSNNDEGIRNLSHMEIPSPNHKKEDKIKGHSEKDNLIKNYQIVSNIVNFPNQQGCQHIFQSQQNINIKINVNSNSIKLNSEKEKDKEKKIDKNKYSNIKENIKKEDSFLLKVPKPTPKIKLECFNRKSIIIQENPIFSFEAYPNSLFDFSKKNYILDNDNINNNCNNNNNKDCNFNLNSCYLLSKIPNWKLVSNFVSPSFLSEEKFENIPVEQNVKEKKNFIIYDSKYEYMLEKNLVTGRKNKLLNEIYGIKYSIDKTDSDILKIKNKIKEKEFKLKCLSIKKDCIDNALKDNRKED